MAQCRTKKPRRYLDATGRASSIAATNLASCGSSQKSGRGPSRNSFGSVKIRTTFWRTRRQARYFVSDARHVAVRRGEKSLGRRIISNVREIPWTKRLGKAAHTWKFYLRGTPRVFFSGFLPTPARLGQHALLFAAEFACTLTTTDNTFVFEQATLPEALAAAWEAPVSLTNRMLSRVFYPGSFRKRIGVQRWGYTSSLHYSSEYAVGQTGILDIIERFNSRTDSERSVADFGAFLDLAEQKRRFVIKSLLRADGVSHAAYEDRFGSTIEEDFPALNELLELGLAVNSTSSFRLTDNGLSWSDTIGPWLYSEAVTNRMGSYELA